VIVPKTFLQKLKQRFSGQFIRNVGWLGIAELINRVSRLGVTIVLARTFSAQDYGLMAILYTVMDFATVFTMKGGIGAKIIQTNKQDLDDICNTSYWLNWILCCSVFGLQCVSSFPIANFYKSNELIFPLCVAASIYLMFPLFMVQASLIERENRLKITALVNATQTLVSNALTIILLMFQMGIWAIVLPLLLTTPIRMILIWKNHSWRPSRNIQFSQWQAITSFGGNLLGIELLGRLKSNLDYLIIGSFLGVDALGLYYFGFNAGLAITLNIITMFSSAIFPYLCEVRSDFKQLWKRFWDSIKKSYTLILPLIILQVALAPFYVPVLFGHKWTAAIPIVIMICLSALPMSLGNATYYLLNAVDKSRITLYWNLINTIGFGVCLLYSVRLGIFWVAGFVLLYQLVTVPLFSAWGIRNVFGYQLSSVDKS